MSNPNLITISSVIGKTVAQAITTSESDLVANPSGSGKVYKINVLYVANASTSADASVTVSFVRSSSSTKIANAVLVSTKNTLVVVAKDTALYLEEGDSLKILASNNTSLEAVVSYEIIS